MSNSLQIDQKIQTEKRRRNQLYITLDYFLSSVNYFDYFSFDSFSIAKYSKYFASLCNEKQVTSDYLIYTFFLSSPEISIFLNEFGITTDSFLGFFKSKNDKNKIVSFFEKRTSWFSLETVVNKVENIEFSYEVNLLFEKASTNAFFRFKTPIITAEILFLTLLEEKETKSYKILKKLLKNETLWYLLRYRLIKKIHTQESILRGEISKNQQFFAYLLRTQVNEKEYDKLLTTQMLGKGVSLFRNTLISSLLTKNYFDEILKELSLSIQLTNTRRYSS